MTALRLAALLPLALAAQAAPPAPGELRTFGDWTAGCDNARACRAVALAPAEGEGDYLRLLIERDAAGSAAALLRVPIGEGVARGTALTLAVDGKPVGKLIAPGGARGLDLPLGRELADAMANGRVVTLGTGAGAARASLAGSAAAMLWIDEQQRRLGTRGALRRPGTRPDASVPAPPPLPVIAQPAPGTRPPRTLSVKQATRLIGRDNAVCDYAAAPVAPEAYRLDAGHSLVTVDHPCGNGAYNLFTSVFVLDEKGRANPAAFDVPAGMGEGPGNQIVTGGWDAGTRRLTSFARGRGIGDCGTQASYAWDGTRFRLATQSAMGECRGARDYITTWRARVVPR